MPSREDYGSGADGGDESHSSEYVPQRSVEVVVADTCWNQGSHGAGFWPWAMAGERGASRRILSAAYYDHLNCAIACGRTGATGCGSEMGDVREIWGDRAGLGHYDEAQRETWTVFVRHVWAARTRRCAMESPKIRSSMRRRTWSVIAGQLGLLAHAIDSWSDRRTCRLAGGLRIDGSEGYVLDPTRAGTHIELSPSLGRWARILFGRYVLTYTKDGAELG